MNSKDIGDATEAAIISRMVTAEYNVSVPFGENDGYDLIVDDDTDLHRVQCKMAW